jgi:hypothetical protein
MNEPKSTEPLEGLADALRTFSTWNGVFNDTAIEKFRRWANEVESSLKKRGGIEPVGVRPAEAQSWVDRAIELAAQWGDERVRACYTDGEGINPDMKREALRQHLAGVPSHVETSSEPQAKE